MPPHHFALIPILALLLASCDAVTSSEPEPFDLLWAAPHVGPFDGFDLDPLLSGDLVVAAPNRHITALHAATGDTAWTRPWPHAVFTAETEWTVSGGTAFVAAAEHAEVLALDLATGQTIWSAPLPGGAEVSMHTHAGLLDGSVYVPTRTRREWFVARLDEATGEPLGLFALPQRAHAVVGVGEGAAATLVAVTGTGGTDDGQGMVLGLHPETGEERWRVELAPGEGRFSDAPLLTDGRRVWAGATYGSGRVLCLDAASGEVMWERRESAFEGDLVETPQGLRYLLNTGTRLRALNAGTGTVIWDREFGGHSGDNAAYRGGVVYHSHGYGLYALDGTTGEVLAEHWWADGSAPYDVEAGPDALYVITNGAVEARALLPSR